MFNGHLRSWANDDRNEVRVLGPLVTEPADWPSSPPHPEAGQAGRRLSKSAFLPGRDLGPTPAPLVDLGWILAVLAAVATGFEAGVDHLLTEGRGLGFEAGNPVQHIDDEMEPIEVVEHHHVERGRCRAFLLVPANVDVWMVPPPIGQAMDQQRIAAG